jgi:hypothetical protein
MELMSDWHNCEELQVATEVLAPRNTQITRDFLSGAIFVETCKLDEKKRVRPTSLVATFCPMCGAVMRPKKEPIP